MATQEPVVTTETPTASCQSLLNTKSTWNTGWNGNVQIQVPTQISSWEVEFKFTQPLLVFEQWTGNLTTTSDKQYSVSNDQPLNAGATLSFEFLYRWNFGGTFPAITTIKLNGQDMCIGSGSPVIQPTKPPVTGISITQAPYTGSGCFAEDSPYNYDEVLHKSLLFYEAQRSGYLPASQRVTWRKDSATDDAIDDDTGEKVDLEGGYYDAGDYVKFGFPMAAATTVLAWGAIEYGDAYIAAGEMTYMKEAVKWATDYFIKAHPEPNVFYGQVGDGHVDHKFWIQPEDMTMYRPAFKITTSKPGSELAGETAAALVATSILFNTSDPSYSASCLQHAKDLYNFANQYQGKYSDSIENAASFYKNWGTYYDELAWAAAWLYRATGNMKYISDAKSHYSKSTNDVGEFSWDEKKPGVQVLLAEYADQSDRSTYADDLKRFCDKIVYEKEKTPKGLVFISQWGSLRYAANAAFVCLRAADLGINTNKYRNFGRQQIHYMLGDAGRSFVVGFGNNPPVRPHHASSSCPPSPTACGWDLFNSPDPNVHELTGALVGGPDASDNYQDNRNDYISNEVTTDYNAGFQGAVAALRFLAICSNDTSTTYSYGTSTQAAPTAHSVTSEASSKSSFTTGILPIKETTPESSTQESSTSGSPVTRPTQTPITGSTITQVPYTGSGCFAEDSPYNYDEVLHKSLLFYEAQRSGYLPASQRVTWRKDSATDDAIDDDTGEKVDLEGGYYDAGDYVKFGFPMAAATTVLAWGAIEYGDAYIAAGEMTYMKEAVKWATDYFIKAHPEPNVFYGQVGDGHVDHKFWIQPEDMTMYRPAFKITTSKPGSELAGETAAALAATSILFNTSDPSYSASCLQHAKDLYNFANQYQGKYSDSIENAASFYKNWGTYYDELAWAAAWLYRATGNMSYISDAKSHYFKSTNDVEEFSWDEKKPGVQVLLAQCADQNDRSTYANDLKRFCDKIVDEKEKTPKGLVFISKWGSLRYAANAAFVCLRAADLGINTNKYRNFGRQQIHYMLGDAGRSFVVGFGNNPPVRPHHASSSCPPSPAACGWDLFNSPDPNVHELTGALVGGPDASDNYQDNRNDYISNEVTTDYNAGFQGAVAALRSLSICFNNTSAQTSPSTLSSVSEASSETLTTTRISLTSTSGAAISNLPSTHTATTISLTTAKPNINASSTLASIVSSTPHVTESSIPISSTLVISTEGPTTKSPTTTQLALSSTESHTSVSFAQTVTESPIPVSTTKAISTQGPTTKSPTTTQSTVSSTESHTSVSFAPTVTESPIPVSTTKASSTQGPTTRRPTTTPPKTSHAENGMTSVSVSPNPTDVTPLDNGTSCESLVTVKSSWNTGWNGEFNIPIEHLLESWTVGITLTSPVASLEQYTGDALKKESDTKYTVTKNQVSMAPGDILVFNILYRVNESSLVPAIESVTFNGQIVCIKSEGPIPTPPPGGYPCAEVKVLDQWTNNIKLDLSITFPVTVASWEIDLTFSDNIDSIQAYTAVESTVSGNSVTLTNENYNGVQDTGNVLVLQMQVTYSTSSGPQIASVTVAGIEVCIDYYVSTTATPSVTESPTNSQSTVTPSTAVSQSSMASNAALSTTLPTTTTKFPTTVSLGEGTLCENLLIVKSSWNVGWNGLINIPIQEILTTWTLTIELTSPVTNFEQYNGGVLKEESDTKYTVNKNQVSLSPGEILAFDMLYSFDIGQLPTFKKITFNGQVICLKPDDPTPTTPSGGYTCTTVKVTNQWEGNIQLDVTVTFPVAVASWNIELTFSDTISSINAFTAVESAISGNSVTLSNENYNGIQAAGASLVLSMQVSFVASSTPVINHVNISGIEVCVQYE